MNDVRTAVLPFCRTAVLPFCRSAVLPFCRSAVLPFCRSAVWLMLSPCVIATFAETVEENYPSGALHLRFEQRDGEKNGKYEEYHENGELKARVNYRKNLREGKLQEFDEQGKPIFAVPYRKGLREGVGSTFANRKQVATHRWRADELLQYNGMPVCTRNRETIAKDLKKVYARAEGVSEENREQMEAVCRLNAYRYLVGVPDDVRPDEKYIYYAQAGSVLIDRLGRLDHKPENPGLPEKEYKDGYNGTSHSNLHMGQESMASSVDGYMHDSDPSNIDRVGHRSWCVNPAMQKTGFGRTNGFSAMWSMDESRGRPFRWTEICYPSAGNFPIEYFGPTHAWSIWLNPEAYPLPSDFDVEVRPLDAFLRIGEPLPIDHKTVCGESMGPGQVLIFRPTGFEVAHERRYLVRASGLVRSNQRPAEIAYIVEFTDLSQVVVEEPKQKSRRRSSQSKED